MYSRKFNFGDVYVAGDVNGTNPTITGAAYTAMHLNARECSAKQLYGIVNWLLLNQIDDGCDFGGRQSRFNKTLNIRHSGVGNGLRYSISRLLLPQSARRKFCFACGDHVCCFHIHWMPYWSWLPLGCMFWLNLIRPRLNIQLRSLLKRQIWGDTSENSGLRDLILTTNNRTYEHNPQQCNCNHSSFDIQNFQRDGGFRNGCRSLMMWLSLTWDGFIGISMPGWYKLAYSKDNRRFYQVLARRGRTWRCSNLLTVSYGNRQIGTAADIDRFWLQGPLQITWNKFSSCNSCIGVICPSANNGSQRHHGAWTNSDYTARKDRMVRQH